MSIFRYMSLINLKPLKYYTLSNIINAALICSIFIAWSTKNI